ncbi:MAG: trigger factor [Candidatus Omnitrophota bacterium]|jgi:FKBP-type peptidyl-prolyl cis-trans isomerase (trigger factor)
MKTEVKKIDSTKRQLTIAVTGDVVKDKFEDVFKKIAQEAKIPGFRPGHAPRDILEKNFSSHAQEQVLKELIPGLYQEAVQKEGLDVLGLPEISEVKLDRTSLAFTATVEVSPEIKLKDYKGLKVNYKKIEVNPDELKRNLDSLKESRKLDALDDNFAKSQGFPDLAELEKVIERQIFIEKESLQRHKIEEGIIEKISGDLDFKVPASLVSRQLEELLRQAKVDLALKGMERGKIEEQEKELKEKLEPEAKKQVKIYLVLAEIAKKENIPLDDHMPRRVIELLLTEASWQREAS